MTYQYESQNEWFDCEFLCYTPDGQYEILNKDNRQEIVRSIRKKPLKLSDLQTGDIIKHKMFKDNSYIVTANYGDRVTAVNTVDITNSEEWEIVIKSNYNKKE